MTIALTIVHVILSVLLIAIVLFQSGNEQGLSGSIGGASESFFGKNKARTMDAMLAKCTSIIAVLFIATSIVLSLILN
ncbi:MAG: preprotein translocase subunit SecG [Clostridia bacterium]|nr:preprotein translocase subunit SecG [Clostridia bacterium]MBO7289402.1 preprotein translocase subunit SecG [Clostridia bacterium]